ncbi:Metalloprotease mig-17, partial [Biomphalaria glabrata]
MEGSRYVTILMLWNMLINSPIDSTQVQIYINSEGLSDIDLPSKLQVSFSLNEQSRTKLDLRLEPHYHLDIPVYTVHKRKNGNYVTQKVDLVETKNVGIYRNVRHQALFQVTRSHELQSNVSIQTGQFQKDGHMYKVMKRTRVKREAVDDVMYEVESYDITPIINPKLDQIDLVLKNKQKAPNIYEVPTNKSKETRTHSQRRPHQARPKRSLTVPTYYIDIAAFVDSTAFQKFLQHAGYNTTLTYLQMREYYAFLFSGINMIYQGLGSDKFKLQVSLSRLVVFEKASDFRLIFIPTYSYQTYFNDFSFRTQVISTKVDSEKVFEKFNQYLTMSARDVTSHNDHAMFFVGSDLWVNYLNLIHQDILGLAHKSSLCETNGKSSSLIEENVDYTNLIVAAHELGHRGDRLANGAVRGERLANGAVRGERLANHLANGAVRGERLANGAVRGDRLANGAVRGDRLANGAVRGERLANGAVRGERLANNLANGAVRGDRLANGAVRGDRLAYGAVRGDRLANGAVRGDSLANGAVRRDRLANGAVKGERLANHLANGAVRGDRLANGAVREDRLANWAVRGDRLANGAVRGDRLANGAVRGDRLANGAVRGDRLANGAVRGERLANGAVRGERLSRLFNLYNEGIDALRRYTTLSAEHDSTNNDCTQKEDYLMTMVWNTDDSSKMKHLWQFSNCSLAYIESFITNLSHTA